MHVGDKMRTKVYLILTTILNTADLLPGILSVKLLLTFALILYLFIYFTLSVDFTQISKWQKKEWLSKKIVYLYFYGSLFLWPALEAIKILEFKRTFLLIENN